SIVKGVISLADAFQKEVIAEGVETVGHGVELLRMGCEHAQGYVIARPMEARHVPDWVRNFRIPDAWADIRGRN
ncbi:MAG TPA: EAL domain-containing protein, partial [Burkholderiales bacterium]|nr:EAL domain-containing protein [Burkholderiales bacterium]